VLFRRWWNSVSFFTPLRRQALADTVGLRALGLGAGVVDVLDRQVELLLVALAAAELGAAIGQHARPSDAMLVVERHNRDPDRTSCSSRYVSPVVIPAFPEAASPKSNVGRRYPK
jgi:hypothetical protein